MYFLCAYWKLEVDAGKCLEPELEGWDPLQFTSLKAAKDFADEQINKVALDEPCLIMEVQERKGPRAKTGTPKYRVERAAEGKITKTPLV